MPEVPRALAEVPLPRLDPLVLLNLQPDSQGRRRAVPDHDFAGHGFGVVDDLVLESDDGTRREVPRALVLALHSADEPSPGPGLELELDVPDPAGGEPLCVLAPLDAFLRVHLPALPSEPDDVVLALCNPASAEVVRPAALAPDRRLHYAHGDVLSWLDEYEGGRTQIRLRARSWHLR
ncbi:MAG: hypothetical protein KDK70_20310 [Myxococcales bacterium]|nr:hypothetical protein [Myxococcales bacterium]